MINPSKQGEYLNSPTERASNINDPQFENAQGYFPYDLTHTEFITPLFGQITPTMHLDVVPGDRVVVHDNTKLLLNQINGNFLSNLNQYVDSFFVPFRSVYGTNYEKLMPNPVKGDDIVNTALPQVPILAYLKSFYRDNEHYSTIKDYDGEDYDTTVNDISDNIDNIDIGNGVCSFYLSRLLLLSTVLSRGQLLDYLGFALDTNTFDAVLSSKLQKAIDDFHLELYSTIQIADAKLRSYSFDLTTDVYNYTIGYKTHDISTLSNYRNALSDIFEAGRYPYFENILDADMENLKNAINELLSVLDVIFTPVSIDYEISHLENINNSSNPFENGHCINIGKILAYQQVVAEYFTNDHVDNIFSADLFNQNLRSIMFPSEKFSITTTEPVFEMNGVKYEYDYISYGSFWYSLISGEQAGTLKRQYVWATVMLLLRRSLRYGDYFATARPNMLAVSDQLGISVDGNSTVSPIDVTKNLLLQRYLNASNYIGQGFLQYMSSIYGIKPSDTGTHPRFISHRKIELQNQITNNTADNQGAQTTNIVGYSDSVGFDCFIDDFGYIISVTSFDVLPVYKSGIDSTWRFSDRYDFFNPMLQNIGDQPIRSSELLGFPELYTDTFGYTMRNAEYKFKLSKAHGAFVNSLPGFMLSYPLQAYNESIDEYDLNIDPDFIRDKPVYLDAVVPQMQGVSPAEYYHFIVSCNNQVKMARKITATPSVLF